MLQVLSENMFAPELSQSYPESHGENFRLGLSCFTRQLLKVCDRRIHIASPGSVPPNQSDDTTKAVGQQDFSRGRDSDRFSALPTKASAMYAPELKANSDEIKLVIVD